MTVYAIAQISIHDRERYDRYVAGFMSILDKYQGKLLAADEAPEVVEGDWDYDKVVLMAFEDHVTFQRWANSEEYQEISRDRIAATEGVTLLVQGLSSPRR